MPRDNIFWEYLEELAELQTAWHGWHRRLSPWHRFNTFYTHYMKVEDRHAKFLECTTPCNYGCPRQVVENTPYDIAAICSQEKAAPIKLKFKDILIYSLRHEDFHKAICVSLQIEQTSGSKLSECSKAWYLGEYSGATVYLAYHIVPVMLTETVSSLCLLTRKAPFMLMAPTRRGMTIEAQQMLEENDSVFLALADELTLQSDGSFKVLRRAPGRINPAINAE